MVFGYCHLVLPNFIDNFFILVCNQDEAPAHNGILVFSFPNYFARLVLMGLVSCKFRAKFEKNSWKLSQQIRSQNCNQYLGNAFRKVMKFIFKFQQCSLGCPIAWILNLIPNNSVITFCLKNFVIVFLMDTWKIGPKKDNFWAFFG